MHCHQHQHNLEIQNWICPIAETCTLNNKHNPCSHANPHSRNPHCLYDDIMGCPECIMTQEVIDEETFTEEEFDI